MPLNPVGSKHEWQILVQWISSFPGEVLKWHRAHGSCSAVWACQGVICSYVAPPVTLGKIKPYLKTNLWNSEPCCSLKKIMIVCHSFPLSFSKRWKATRGQPKYTLKFRAGKLRISKCNIQFSGVGTFPFYESWFSFETHYNSSFENCYTISDSLHFCHLKK